MTPTEGVPIRYGQGERWKSVRERIGRTKPSRAPNVAVKKRKKNDGRPPDTVNELLQRSPSKKKQKQVDNLKKHLAIPGPRSVALKVNRYPFCASAMI